MLRLLERDITSGKGGSNEEDFCTVFAHISARIAEREEVHVNPILHSLAKGSRVKFTFF